jgi:hypothetical protein
VVLLQLFSGQRLNIPPPTPSINITSTSPLHLYHHHISLHPNRIATITTMTLERFFGPSRTTFLARNVRPLGPTDVVDTDRCLVCGEGYNINHGLVRVLPCNHIFGNACLRDMTKQDRGNVCPLCRTKLFRTPFKASMRRKARCVFWMSSSRAGGG